MAFDFWRAAVLFGRCMTAKQLMIITCSDFYGPSYFHGCFSQNPLLRGATLKLHY